MRTIFLLTLSALLVGCVAPGSAGGRLGLKIHAETEAGAPPSVSVILSREYGLGGLDSYFGSPEDYGHRDLEESASFIDGSCRIEFPPIVYHISFWLLPPLGAHPKHPPEPWYWIRFAGREDELYLIGFEKRQFTYRVFDRVSRKEKPKSDGAWLFSDGAFTAERMPSGGDVWFLEVEIKAAQPGATDNPDDAQRLREDH